MPLIVALGALAVAPAASAEGLTVVDRKEVDVGDRVTLLSNQNFKVIGDCVDNGGGDYTADSFIKAKQENLVLDTYSGTGDPDFDPSDGKVSITNTDATGTAPAFEAAEYQDFYAEGQNRTPLNGRMVTGVHLKGADCMFSATFTGGDSAQGVEAVKRVKADAGETETLFSNDDFKLTGRCIDNGGGDFTANTYLAAKQNGLVYYLTEADLFDTDFDSNEPKVDLFPSFADASGTTPEYQADSFEQDLWAEGKGGKTLQGRVASGVHMKGADCVFSGIFVGYGDVGQLHVVNRMEVNAGKTKTIYSNDDFKATGKCRDNGGGDYTADTLLAAKRNNLIMYQYNGDPFFDLDFDEADPKGDISSEDAEGAAPDYYSEDDYSDFVGDGRVGQLLAGRLGGGVHVGGADCTFSGIFIG